MSDLPKGQPWVWVTRDLLRRPEWRGLGNARRLIDFPLLDEEEAMLSRVTESGA